MKKVFLVIIMLITSLIAKPLDGDINNTNENLIQNILTEEQEISSENTISDEEIIEPLQEDIDGNDTIEGYNDKTIEIENNNNSNNTSQKVKEQPKVETKTESTSQQKEEPVVTQPTKTETSSSTSNTKQESKYWCVDGGSHHVAGDGENEHGYYATWDEAFSAFQSNSKDWSGQYKISQCWCGLYYYWISEY